MLALILFIVVAVAAQWKTFLIALATVFPLVAAHNALGLSLGWGASTLWRLNTADRRAVTIEGGMQNSGLALGLIAAQFSSNIEMVSVPGADVPDGRSVEAGKITETAQRTIDAAGAQVTPGFIDIHIHCACM